MPRQVLILGEPVRKVSTPVPVFRIPAVICYLLQLFYLLLNISNILVSFPNPQTCTAVASTPASSTSAPAPTTRPNAKRWGPPPKVRTAPAVPFPVRNPKPKPSPNNSACLGVALVPTKTKAHVSDGFLPLGRCRLFKKKKSDPPIFFSTFLEDAYKTGAHVGKVWWGTGGDAASRAKPLNSKGLFRLTLVASAVAAAPQGETKEAAPVAAPPDGTKLPKMNAKAKEIVYGRYSPQCTADPTAEASSSADGTFVAPTMKPKEICEMMQYSIEFNGLVNPGFEFKGETRSIRDLGMVKMTSAFKDMVEQLPIDERVGMLLTFQQKVIDGEMENPGIEFAPGSKGFGKNLPAYDSDTYDSDDEDTWPSNKRMQLLSDVLSVV